MIERQGKYGKLLGCKQYSDCRYWQPLNGQRPQVSRTVVVKRSEGLMLVTERLIKIEEHLARIESKLGVRRS